VWYVENLSQRMERFAKLQSSVTCCMKRARFGFKIYQLWTSSGILLDFLIYHGNSSSELTQLPDFLTTEKIPITLLQPYLNNGHIFFTDNFYTTPRLAQYLLQNGTGLVGTVKPNRKNFPKALASSSLGKGILSR